MMGEALLWAMGGELSGCGGVVVVSCSQLITRQHQHRPTLNFFYSRLVLFCISSALLHRLSEFPDELHYASYTRLSA